MIQGELMSKIFLFGGGMHGHTCIDVIEKQGKYEIIGIIDSQKTIGTFINGYQIIGRMEDLPKLITKYNIKKGFIAIGDNWVRNILSREIYSYDPDFEFINAIHPTAVFGKNIRLGKGILIGAQTFISSSCVIGNFCLIHHKVLLGLHNQLGNYSSISLGSLTGGKVTIGENSAITICATIQDRLNIGSNSVIGSGSLVLNDLPDNVVAYGRPAKCIRSRCVEDPYLQSS